MTNTHGTLSEVEPAGIMKPFAADPTSQRRRRQRTLVLAITTAFCVFYGMAFSFFAPFLLVGFAVPIIVLGAIAIWALPGTRTAPARALEVCLFALFTTLVLWPNYLAIAIPGLPWITLIRLTGFPLALLLLVCVSVSADFRARLGQALNAAPLIWKLLVAFVVIQLLSIALSDQKGESIDKFVVAQISWTAVFFASAYVFQKPGRVQLWATMLWVMALAVGAIAVQESRHGQVPWAGHVPGFLKIEDPLVAAIMAGGGRAYTGVYRTQSTFSTPLTLGEYLALTYPFVLHFLVQRYAWPTRLAALLTIPFLAYVAILSGSRSSALGMIVATMLYVLFWAVRRWRTGDSLWGPAITLAYPAIGAAVLAATIFVGRLHRIVWGGGETAASTDARKIQYQTGIPMVLKNPLGHGIGRAADTLGFRTPGGFLTIDSYFLAVALEYGIIGFIVYYAIILSMAADAARAALSTKPPQTDRLWMIPISICLFVFFMIKSVFSQQDNHPLVFMVIGMACALTYSIKNGRDVAAP